MGAKREETHVKLVALQGGRRAALLISEMQNGITNIAYSPASSLAQQVQERNVVGNINRLAAEFRALDLPVVHCTISARPGFVGWNVNCVLAAGIAKAGKLVQGSEWAAIHKDIVVDPRDIVSERHHGMAAFTGTELNSVLRGLRIDTVVLSGVSTNVALMGCSVEAIGLGYSAVLAEDCAAGATADTHEVQIKRHIVNLAAVVQSDDVIAALKEPA